MFTSAFLHSTFFSPFLQIFNRISSKFQDKAVLRKESYCLFSQLTYGKATEINPKRLPTNWLCSQKLEHATYCHGDRLVVACIFPSRKALKNDPFRAFMIKLLNELDYIMLEFPLDGISGKRNQPRGLESHEYGCGRTKQAIEQVSSNKELLREISQAHEIFVLTMESGITDHWKTFNAICRYFFESSFWWQLIRKIFPWSVNYDQPFIDIYDAVRGTHVLGTGPGPGVQEELWPFAGILQNKEQTYGCGLNHLWPDVDPANWHSTVSNQDRSAYHAQTLDALVLDPFLVYRK